MGTPAPTLRELAELLGIERPRATQWLRRYLKSRERDTGRLIMVATGGPKRPTYRVLIAEVRRACPELFNPADQILQAHRAVVFGQRRQLEDLAERMADMEAALGVLAEAMRRNLRVA